MGTEKIIEAVNLRYSGLAESECCLSCGNALSRSGVQPGEVCVDLGSGRGTDVIRLAEAAGPSGFAYGIDISDGMIRKARAAAEKLGVENVKFLQSELETLPLPDAAADLVISNCTINHAKDKQAVWNEIFRILKKGGRFTVSDIYSEAEVPAEYASDPQAVAECWAGAVTKAVYFNQLGKAGFKDVQIIEESAPYKKGAVNVVSFTLLGFKPKGCGCKK